MQIITDTDRKQLAGVILVTRHDTAAAFEAALLALADGSPCSAPASARRLALQASFSRKQSLCLAPEDFQRSLAA